MMRYFNGLFFIACVLSFYIWQQNQSVRLGYRVDQLRRDCERWEQSNRDLRLKLNCLMSMERLDTVARDQKLSAPDEKNTIFLP